MGVSTKDSKDFALEKSFTFIGSSVAVRDKNITYCSPNADT